MFTDLETGVPGKTAINTDYSTEIRNESVGNSKNGPLRAPKRSDKETKHMISLYVT